MKLRRHAVSAHGRETPCATCRHTWAFRVPIWRLATLKVPQPRRPCRSPALQAPRKAHQGNYIRTLRHLEEAEVAEEDRQEQRDGRGATDSREHARHAARADRCARQLAAVLPSLLWQRMLLNLLWSSCSKSGTSAANRWRSSITPQKSSWRYRSPVEAPRVQKTFIDDFPLPLAATCRTREAPEEVLLAILHARPVRALHK